jgi:cell wall-associated NlpC family hydrolase
MPQPGLSPQIFNLLNANAKLVGIAPLPDALVAKPLPVKTMPFQVAPGAGGVKGYLVKNRPWINAVLKQLKAPATNENVRFLDAWAKAEGGGGYSSTSEGQNNWLNTTRVAPGLGGVSFNSAGVKNYPSFQQGVQATVGALTNGYYGNIVNGLRSGSATAQELAQMVAGSKWGTGSGVLRTLSSEPNAIQAGHNPNVAVDFQGKVAPKAAVIIKLAAQYLGTPYHWGGANPRTGFDCSGFVQWLYSTKGVSLPRTTFQQWKVGKPVRGGLKPGDIVFFYPTSAGPDHEGLYIGNGQFIQSPHTGDVIKISKLSDYRSAYMGARRVL